jgi:hypothetical protein
VAAASGRSPCPLERSRSAKRRAPARASPTTRRRSYDTRPVRRRRYIEIDPVWWSRSSCGAPQMAALLRVLAAEGWELTTTRRRARLARRFTTKCEYRAALAKARFAVAEHLTGPPAT